MNDLRALAAGARPQPGLDGVSAAVGARARRLGRRVRPAHRRHRRPDRRRRLRLRRTTSATSLRGQLPARSWRTRQRRLRLARDLQVAPAVAHGWRPLVPPVAIRMSVVGCDPNQACDHAGGVRSATDRRASCRCSSTNVAGSSVARSASTSARVSIRRLIPFWTGLASSPARATSTRIRGTFRGSATPPPSPVGRAAAPRHEQGQQPDAERRTRGTQHRAHEHVLVLGVGELVRDDRERSRPHRGPRPGCRRRPPGGCSRTPTRTRSGSSYAATRPRPGRRRRPPPPARRGRGSGCAAGRRAAG